MDECPHLAARLSRKEDRALRPLDELRIEGDRAQGALRLSKGVIREDGAWPATRNQASAAGIAGVGVILAGAQADSAMNDPDESPAPSPEPLTPASEQAAKKKKKKKDKVRSAWISFIGRILAQLVGAAATIVLGLLFVHKYQSPSAKQSELSVSPARAEHVTQHKAERRSGELVLAVLPLQNFSADQHQEFLADGMTEALITDLAQVQGLRVISRTSSMLYKGTRKALPEIAKELGADLIVEGSVVRDTTRVRVTAQLINAATDDHLWARSYDRPIHDVLSLQAEVATAIVREVNAAIASRRVQQSRPTNPSDILNADADDPNATR